MRGKQKSSGVKGWAEGEKYGGFPGRTVVRTPSFYCLGPGSNPWWGINNPTSQGAGEKKKSMSLISASHEPSVTSAVSAEFPDSRAL